MNHRYLFPEEIQQRENLFRTESRTRQCPNCAQLAFVVTKTETEIRSACSFCGAWASEPRPASLLTRLAKDN